jgi:hypothetical protein
MPDWRTRVLITVGDIPRNFTTGRPIGRGNLGLADGGQPRVPAANPLKTANTDSLGRKGCTRIFRRLFIFAGASS